jgi:hypothetical protein
MSGEDDEADATVHRCDYCRQVCPSETRTLERQGETYEFCSRACRDALADSDRIFTEYHGFRRLETGVSVLDGALPEGVPRNSFVLLSDLPGSRVEAIQAELVWRALGRGEPAVYVSFLEPPGVRHPGFRLPRVERPPPPSSRERSASWIASPTAWPTGAACTIG